MFLSKGQAASGDIQSLAEISGNLGFQEASDYVLIFLLLSVLFIISQLFLLRLRKSYLNNKKTLVQYRTNGFLSEIIFSEDQSEKFIDNKINEFKKKVPFQKPWCKDLLIQNIIDLDKNFKGQNGKLLHAIYFKLELHGYTENLVNSKIWYLKAKGIYYWRELQYTNAVPKIYGYLTHSNPELRSAALLAYISLSEDENPLAVLQTYVDTITYVEMLNLMHVIQRRKFKKPANLKSWLSSKNDSHVIFALKLVAHFNDLESGQVVTQLLGSGNAKIRNEAIKTIGKLFLFEAEQDLIIGFFKENEENQMEIVLTLKEIGGRDSIQFIHHLLSMDKGAELKLTAMYALKALDSKFSETEFDPQKSLDKFKKHVLSPYLEI
ncbi:HEAT repeat domain-containing protein [Cecembia lonarensis]|uniref:HEAT repeat protein n=1 Tax=Cecembia lonarensis (strain CCUG 58316 / KCTC 22772 / LW9) TaxID=1225176 RepID=K1L7R7_CECL9|nr:hypothetical protein [Cecembia lonarensis]EKB50721.1 hypothetical protein B879_00701 [Cecembia lonarensis LW9]